MDRRRCRLKEYGQCCCACRHQKPFAHHHSGGFPDSKPGSHRTCSCFKIVGYLCLHPDLMSDPRGIVTASRYKHSGGCELYARP